MRITEYSVELTDELHPSLVKEQAFNGSEYDFTKPAGVVNMLNEAFRLNRKAEEYVYLLAFSTNQKLLGVFELSHGNINSSIVDPRDIFIKLLLCGAAGFIVAHNHPSGNVAPSTCDISIADELVSASKIMKVNMLDFLVVGDGYYSFSENTLLKK